MLMYAYTDKEIETSLLHLGRYFWRQYVHDSSSGLSRLESR